MEGLIKQPPPPPLVHKTDHDELTNPPLLVVFALPLELAAGALYVARYPLLLLLALDAAPKTSWSNFPGDCLWLYLCVACLLPMGLSGNYCFHEDCM